MSIVRRAELDLVGFDVGNDLVTRGHIALRWRKLTYFDDKLISSEYHRANIDVDTDISATLAAINADLVQKGFLPMPASDEDYVRVNADLAWTPEVRAAVKADRDAKKASAEAAAEQAEQARAEAELAAEAQRVSDFKALAEKAGLVG